MADEEKRYPIEVLDGVPVEFRPDSAYDMRTGEPWVAYRFVKPLVKFVIIDALSGLPYDCNR